MKHFITLVFFCGWLSLAGKAYSQDYFAVHFKFKPQTSYSLNQPASFLTSKALERKGRFNIALDSMDLPVSERYLEVLQPYILRNLYNSNWLNSAIVQADPQQVILISGFPFVEKVVYIKPGVHVSGRMIGKENKFKDTDYEILPPGQRVAYEAQNAMLGIDKMMEAGYRGKDVTIAVFDAGFPGVDTLTAFRHILSENRMIGTRNFINLTDNVYMDNQHGTNVLSLIGADNPPRMASGAPDSNYILCITEDVRTEFKIEEYNWVRAAEYADSLGVDIINSSLGYLDFDDPGMDYTAADLDGLTAIITQGANIAADKGIIVVNSAGNYGRRGTSSLVAPADARGILSVGGVNLDLARAAFSSQGPTADGRIKPELAALGQSVQLLGPNGQAYLSQGTSFAAPQIAALAAGLWDAKPEWSKDELIEILKASATQANAPDNLLGHGIPDFVKAYYGEILSSPNILEPVEWSMYPNPMTGDDLFIKFGNKYEADFILFDISGKEMVRFNINRASGSEPFRIHLPQLRAGIYIVHIRTAEGIKRARVIKK